MANYPVSGEVFATWEFNPIISYPTNGGYDCAECWKDCIEKEVAEDSGNISYPQYATFGSLWFGGIPVNGRHYRNHRPWANFNLTGLNPDDVGEPYFRSQGGNIESPSYGVAVRMHDGSHLVGADSDYGAIEDGTFLGGALVQAPFGLDYTTPWNVHFNEAGKDFLRSKAGGYCRIGFIGDTLAYPPPYCPGTTFGYQYLFVYYDPTKCYIVTGAGGGYIWVEGIYFAYLDFNRIKRLAEGSLSGGSGDPSYAWVDGDYQYYTDYLGNVRRILGTLTGLTGKTAGQVSLNTKAPMLGTFYCYIDSSGNERCFEGAIP